LVNVIIDSSWDDENGCLYNIKGNPNGWIVRKADGQKYEFDMNGEYKAEEDDNSEDLDNEDEEIGGNDLDQWDDVPQKIEKKPSLRK
jgi:hypothetical protein